MQSAVAQIAGKSMNSLLVQKRTRKPSTKKSISTATGGKNPPNSKKKRSKVSTDVLPTEIECDERLKRDLT